MAHLASRAGLETAHGKSSPGPPPKPNHDIRLDVGEASAATALSSTLGMTPCPATRGSVRASPVSAGDAAGAGQCAGTLCVRSSQRGARVPPGRAPRRHERRRVVPQRVRFFELPLFDELPPHSPPYITDDTYMLKVRQENSMSVLYSDTVLLQISQLGHEIGQLSRQPRKTVVCSARHHVDRGFIRLFFRGPVYARRCSRCFRSRALLRALPLL